MRKNKVKHFIHFWKVVSEGTQRGFSCFFFNELTLYALWNLILLEQTDSFELQWIENNWNWTELDFRCLGVIWPSANKGELNWEVYYEIIFIYLFIYLTKLLLNFQLDS